jgi:methylenetetrahydrofolate dehydrogenase (NADP+) / methenyltetrahydrofolate cyclohydrolase
MPKHICKIIDGRGLAEKIKDGIVREIAEMDENSSLEKGEPGMVYHRPNLAIILIGSREDSLLYVDMKEREAKKVGIDTHVYKCDSDIAERDIFDMIDHLNSDDLIDGILVQLPLPENFNTDAMIKAIDPKKDADFFHPKNLENLLRDCEFGNILPPVCGTVLAMLEDIGFESKNKKACVIANSEIFGKTLAKVLSCKNMEVHISKYGDNDLVDKASGADLLISAVGQPGYIKGDMIKKDAVVIDVGISKEDKKIKGDVDFEEAIKKASYITPVPGGVGPMTIAMLFKNTLELYKKRNSANGR